MSTLPPIPVVQSDPLGAAYAEMERLVTDQASQATERVVRAFSLESNPDAILELIYLELVLRRERGQHPELSEFQTRFPALQEPLARLFEVDSVVAGPESLVTPHGGETQAQTAALALGSEWTRKTLGQYQLHEVIGRGGMGVVYRATQQRLNRDVAIKTLNLPASVDPLLRERFKSEAALAARLQHPNIVPIYEIGSDAGVLFFSMELVSGGSLGTFLQGGPLSADMAARLVAVLARAVAYAHAQGVVHRDLKPSNVLMAPSSRPEAMSFPAVDQQRAAQAAQAGKFPKFEPKIGDFGLAKQLDAASELTATGALLGTPSFMAPEQVTGSAAVGPACDIYSLGAILFNAVSGRPPFLSATPIETARQVREVEATPLRQLQPQTPRDLETICQKCLRKNPLSRYGSSTELAEDLERFLGGKPIAAKPASMAERTGKWIKRHPSLTGLMVAISLALVSITILWRSAETSRNAEQTARSRAERLLYARDLSILYSQYRLNHIDIKRARDLLDQVRSDYRGWEWRYLRGLCDQPLWESPQRNLPVEVATLSPDGRWAAIGYGQWGKNNQEPIEVWDTWENRLVWKLKGHPACHVCSLQFSPDGKRLASSGYVWKNSGGKKAGVLMWNLEQGQLERLISDVDAYVISFTKGGESLLIGESTGIIAEHSCADGSRIRELRGNQGLILDMRLSPDGRYCASSGRNGTWGVFDLETGQIVHLLKDQGDIREVCWSGDGKSLFVSSFIGTLQVYRFSPDQLTLLHSDKHTALPYLAMSPDGMRQVLAVFGNDTEIRDASSKELLHAANAHGGHTRSLSFDRSGQRLMTGGNDGVARLWSMTHPNAHMKTDNLINGSSAAATVCSPDGRHIAVATRPSNTKWVGAASVVEIRDAKNLSLLQVLKGHSAGLTSVAYRDDGLQLVSASRDKTVQLWDTLTFEVQAVLQGHRDEVLLARYLAGGRQVVSVDQSGQVCVWDSDTHEPLGNWNLETFVTTAAIHGPHQLLAVNSPTGENQLWDLKTRKRIRSWPSQGDEVLAFNQQGTVLVTAGNRPEIEAWKVEELQSEASTVQPRLRLAGSMNAAYDVTFTADDSRLFAAGHDEKIHVFDMELGNELLTLDSLKGTGSQLAFSQDGDCLFLANSYEVVSWRILDRATEPALSEEYTPAALSRWHQTQWELAAATHQSHAAVFHLTELIRLEPDRKERYSLRAQHKMALGDWQGASEDFLKGLDDESPLLLRADYARSLWMMHQRDEYEQQCKRLVDPIRLTDSQSIHRCARTIALAPDSGALAKSILPVVQKQLAQNEEAGLMNSLALLHYRCGNYRSSAHAARRALRLGKEAADPTGWQILALATLKSASLSAAQNTTQDEPNENRESEKNSEISDCMQHLSEWIRFQTQQQDLGMAVSLELSRSIDEVKLLNEEWFQENLNTSWPRIDLTRLHRQ